MAFLDYYTTSRGYRAKVKTMLLPLVFSISLYNTRRDDKTLTHLSQIIFHSFPQRQSIIYFFFGNYLSEYLFENEKKIYFSVI